MSRVQSRSYRAASEGVRLVQLQRYPNHRTGKPPWLEGSLRCVLGLPPRTITATSIVSAIVLAIVPTTVLAIVLVIAEVCRCIALPTGLLTLLELQSHFGDKPLKFQVICPQNGTAVLKGLISICVLHRITTTVVRMYHAILRAKLCPTYRYDLAGKKSAVRRPVD